MAGRNFDGDLYGRLKYFADDRRFLGAGGQCARAVSIVADVLAAVSVLGKLGDRLFEKLITVTAWFVIVQSAIGVVQFALSRNGDAVAGTFGLLDFYLNTISITQVYFTFTIFGMILFLLLDTKQPISKLAIVAGLLACAIAHSGHQTIFFVASLTMFSVVQFKRIGTAVRAAAMGVFLIFLMVQIYPETWTHTREWYRKANFWPGRKTPSLG